MTHNLRFRKENLQIPEKVNESRFLLSGHGVLPPLKLRPVISKHYIDTWYHASQMVLRASKIIILGYSFSSADNYFCDMLRENHDAQIIIIDKNMETISRNVCRCLQLDANRYTRQIKDGHEIRKYNNRVTIIGADLADVNLDDLEL